MRASSAFTLPPSPLRLSIASRAAAWLSYGSPPLVGDGRSLSLGDSLRLNGRDAGGGHHLGAYTGKRDGACLWRRCAFCNLSCSHMFDLLHQLGRTITNTSARALTAGTRGRCATASCPPVLIHGSLTVGAHRARCLPTYLFSSLRYSPASNQHPSVSFVVGLPLAHFTVHAWTYGGLRW